MDEVVESVFHWGEKHARILESRARYLDIEGAIRSGKSTVGVRKVQNIALDYPGINILVARYTQDALDAQLKPLFYDVVPQSLLGDWHPDEEYREVGASRVYLRALKSSEGLSRYAKFQGLTLGALFVGQAEEVPDDVAQVAMARCSQRDTPMQRIFDANPPEETHWLAREFPDDPSKMPPDHELIRLSLYDNAQNLPAEYISDLERQYPEGHPLHQRFILGQRGVGYLGQPIYGKLFSRGIHVGRPTMSPELSVYEAWDFGRAAVVWAQFPLGRRVYLGELMGAPGEYLETFVPKALDLRARLFPDALEFQSCCDPAGADRTSHGTAQNAVALLGQHGVFAKWVPGSNHPERRSFAIQQIAAHLSRIGPDGPGLVVHERCKTLIAGFEAGYVRDDHAPQVSASPSIIRPKKDGTFDHLMNCMEYLELNFGGPLQLTVKDRQRMTRRQLVEAQRDIDPYDRIRQRQQQIHSRGGY